MGIAKLRSGLEKPVWSRPAPHGGERERSKEPKGLEVRNKMLY